MCNVAGFFEVCQSSVFVEGSHPASADNSRDCGQSRIASRASTARLVILPQGCGLDFELAPTILPTLLGLRGRRRRKRT